MYDVGMAALQFMLAAATEASNQNMTRWLILPKCHLFHHMLCDQLKELYNCRFYHNYGGEDFMGVLKVSCAQNAGANMHERVLRRSLLKLVVLRPEDVAKMGQNGATRAGGHVSGSLFFRNRAWFQKIW